MATCSSASIVVNITSGLMQTNKDKTTILPIHNQIYKSEILPRLAGFLMCMLRFDISKYIVIRSFL